MTQSNLPTDEDLQRLLNAVKQYQEPSLERRIAMNSLLLKLQRLPGSIGSTHPDYLDALNRTWLWVSQHIHTFDPPKDRPLQVSLKIWIDSYLKWRIKDLYIPDQYYKKTCPLDAPTSADGEGQTYKDLLPDGLGGLEGYLEGLQNQKTRRIGLQLELEIERDPNGKLREIYPQQHPECNCQQLTQKLLLTAPPEKLSKIAREVGIPYQTLVSHWKRKCLPCIQAMAIAFGYQQDLNL